MEDLRLPKDPSKNRYANFYSCHTSERLRISWPADACFDLQPGTSTADYVETINSLCNHSFSCLLSSSLKSCSPAPITCSVDCPHIRSVAGMHATTHGPPCQSASSS